MLKMKICGVICEFNPFHNGHHYLFERIKEYSSCDTIVCIMSGNFTQRGEIACLEKYTRAKHAILAGADAVIELPIVYALSSAESFAKGGIKILSQIPSFEILAFGCETDDKSAFQRAADLLSLETPTFKTHLNSALQRGISFPAARRLALIEEGYADVAEFLDHPNNILGTEYLKALHFYKSKADFLPIRRIGGGYGDHKIYSDYSSAAAIRLAATNGIRRNVRKNIPPFTLKDLKNASDLSAFKNIAVYSALCTDAKLLSQTPDCTEGLENRIKALAATTPDYDELISKITTKRYTSSRIRRILTANMLGIRDEFVKRCFKSDCYIKPLALKKERADELLAEFSSSNIPVIVRRSDLPLPDKISREMFEKDKLADEIYATVQKTSAPPTRPLFI